MAVNTAKRRAKNNAILLSQKKHEPTIDQIDFTTSLSRALGYYSVQTSAKEQNLDTLLAGFPARHPTAWHPVYLLYWYNSTKTGAKVQTLRRQGGAGVYKFVGVSDVC
jgi:hypothetical protein